MGKIVVPGEAQYKFGEIVGANAPIQRKVVGHAKADDGSVYEISTGQPNEIPIVRSMKSGKWWVCQWNKLIELAMEEGLD